MTGKFSMCWDCANSTNKGCVWAERFEPVDGWEAEANKNGFRVLNCPEFVRDSYEYGTRREPRKVKGELK